MIKCCPDGKESQPTWMQMDSAKTAAARTSACGPSRSLERRESASEETCAMRSAWSSTRRPRLRHSHFTSSGGLVAPPCTTAGMLGPPACMSAVRCFSSGSRSALRRILTSSVKHGRDAETTFLGRHQLPCQFPICPADSSSREADRSSRHSSRA